MKNTHTQVARRYFNYLARQFPVMCASDEFHFLPRAEDAANYYDRLDSLEIGRIEDCISELKSFQKEFTRLTEYTNDLEETIDLELLTANAAGVLIELDNKQSWRCNPLLYLKIAFIGLDHALTKPASEPGERMDRALARLQAIPQLLKEACENIGTVPETHYTATLDMLGDCQEYLLETEKHLSKVPSGRVIEKEIAGVSSALSAFKRFIDTTTPLPDQHFRGSTLEASLHEHFLSIRSPEDIYQIAVDEWWETLEKIKALQAKIDPAKSWQALYHQFCPPGIENMDTVSLYRREIDRMQSFFSSQGFSHLNAFITPVEFAETPTYLQSVRASASFAAALTADSGEKSFFYITTLPLWQSSSEADDQLRKRLHREYKPLTAHETIPGHHLLDSVRRNLSNSVRRQVESPLFYEGWASYSESLLTELGYIESPLEYLVEYKRRLWRSARCQIDVGLTTGKLTHDKAMDLLTINGFTPEEAKRQIYRFALNPGYQLCYTLGCHEIVKLRETYGRLLGRERFHANLLEGGQLPFHLAEKRFKSLISS
jgi:uncharacterized protein (DUF885 family)